jgi:hydroxypyruvate reductase
MAAGFEQAVGEDLLESRVSGRVNVPADCVRPLARIVLHAARPAGVNEPTEEGVRGATAILDLLGTLGPRDVCVVLLSGGGSALLPAPVPDITLADKQLVTQRLMHAGATIGELNTVRKQLSRIKGGRLVRATRAGTVLALIVSDVIGDPLDVIASGPTVPDSATPAQALSVLRRFLGEAIPARVRDHLERAAADGAHAPAAAGQGSGAGNGPRVFNHVIGSNATALRAAADEARRIGLRIVSFGSQNAGVARDVGRELADVCRALREQVGPGASPVCVLSGGEPTVRLVPCDRPRKGGRNQEVVLGALDRFGEDHLHDVCLLSGGTDGEDGPTDAAGGVIEALVREEARVRDLRPADFLAVNDAYPFLQRTGGLFVTGPTHTNVMDLRVAVVGRP